MNLGRRRFFTLAAGASAAAALGGAPAANADPAGSGPDDAGPNDAALARGLSGGFHSAYARVNGVRLHYVAGGAGQPLILVPGWPETWWAYHKLMPLLARRYRVVAVDLRGMGGSDKPAGGYDKKTMAADIRALARHLGFGQVNVAGHDIGAMVAFSFAANHPDAARKVALLEVTHPDESLYQIPLLSPPGQGFPLWWFAFNQLSGLPEELLTGRFRYLTDWLFAHLLADQASVSDRDRAVYAAAYSRPDAIRAGNGWYQAFAQDIADQKGYGPITVPLLGLGSPLSYQVLASQLPAKGTDVRVEPIADSGHFTPEEQPAAVADALISFFG